MDGDPSLGNVKQIGAIVTLDSVDRYFACREGETVDFYHTGNISAEAAGQTSPASR